MANDNWRTPPQVFNNLNREFNFLADMAASDNNHLHENYFTEEDNSLSLNWAFEFLGENRTASNKYVYTNPPYSNPLPWIKKAVEAQREGLGVVMLLNADDSTQWFCEALKGVSEVRRIIGYRQGGNMEKRKARIYRLGRQASERK